MNATEVASTHCVSIREAFPAFIEESALILCVAVGWERETTEVSACGRKETWREHNHGAICHHADLERCRPER